MISYPRSTRRSPIRRGVFRRLALLTLLPLLMAPFFPQQEHLRGSSPLDAEKGKVITIPGSIDPHGAADHCTECHATTAEGEADPTWPPQSACERCHPDTNFHLVNVEPEDVECPAKMVLQDGQVKCVTCHDEPACDGLPKDARAKDHFRGGPYRTVLDLCFTCHDRAQYKQTDPHRELRNAEGQRNDAVCIFCHQGVPESERDEKVETLRVDPVELCKGCHAHQIHVGIPSHMKLIPEKMAPRVAQYNIDKTYPIPLGPRGEILCTTCHDPHPGLAPIPTSTSPATLAKLRKNNRDYRDEYYLPRLRQGMQQIVDADGDALTLEDGPAKKDGLLRVPADNGELCMICHDLAGEGL